MNEPQYCAPTSLHRGLLVWRWADPMTILTSAAVRGGLRACTSLVNFGVDLHYARTDLTQHADEIAEELGLTDRPPALLTAARVSAFGSAERGGVLATATVGVTKPTWAADPAGGWSSYAPGTINIVIQLPVVLSSAALVGAVVTATEAKTQALVEHGVPGTGTASDAVAIVCPRRPVVVSSGGAEEAGEAFAGPRSRWGARLAIATHHAVSSGLRRGSPAAGTGADSDVHPGRRS